MTKKLRISATILDCLLLFQLSADVVNAQWVQSAGASMGSVTSFAASGSTLIVGTYSGSIFVSKNNGMSWSGPKVLININSVYQIAVVPAADSSGAASFFAAAYGNPGGVFMSTDGGTSWSGDGLSNSYVECLAANGNELFAGTWGSGIYRTTNLGTDWVPVDSGLTSYNGIGNPTVYSIAVNPPSTGQTADIYAGTIAGIYKSTDDGSHWVHVGLDSTPVYSLAVGGSSGSPTIFAGTNNGVFLSDDGGASWSPADAGVLHFVVSSVAANGSVVAAASDSATFVSTNSGASWSLADVGGPGTSVLALYANNSTLLAGTNTGGVFSSSDNGTTWISLNTDISKYTVSCFASNGSYRFIGTNAGVFASINDGASWSPATIGLGSIGVKALASTGTELLAGTGNGVFLSTNNGAMWQKSDSGLTDTNVTALAYVPASDSSGSGIYLGTPTGMFLSTNGGLTWAKSDSFLTDTVITSIAVVPQPTSTVPLVLAGTTQGVFTTSNFSYWTAANSNLKSNNVSCFTSSGGIVFTGTAGGIFVSNDSAFSWAPSDSNIGSPAIKALVATQPLGQASTVGIYAGGSPSVFLSTDLGVSWSDIGMDLYTVNALAVADTFVLAGTAGSGVWREPISDYISGISRVGPNIPVSFRLYQNYPNPFNPSTVISYQLTRTSRVILKIYDILGREVALLVDRKEGPGTFSVKFDADKFASGVYFYRLMAGGHAVTMKMMVIK